MDNKNKVHAKELFALMDKYIDEQTFSYANENNKK